MRTDVKTLALALILSLSFSSVALALTINSPSDGSTLYDDDVTFSYSVSGNKTHTWANDSADVVSDLQGWWASDAYNATNFFDSSSQTNQGTFNGETLNDGTLGASTSSASDDPTWTSGVFGSALEFDGSDDYVGDIYGIDNPKELSVSVWVKTSLSGDIRAIFSEADWNTYLRKESVGDIWFRILNTTGSGDSFETSGLDISDGNWHHIAVSASIPDNNIKLWVDDTNYIDETIGITGTLDISENNEFVIGKGGNPNWNGSIDSVQIWNRSLSSSEVSEIYQNNKYIRDQQVANWRFDKNSGQTALDTHNLVRDYNLNSKLGGGMTFDGVDDYVDLPEMATGNVSERSYSFWLNIPSTGNRDIFFRESNSYFEVRADDTIRAQFKDANGDTYNLASSSSVAGGWVNAVMVFDNGAMELFIDGNSDDTASTSYDLDMSSSNSIIGAYNPGTLTTNGTIDDVRIYNRSLSQAEIEAIYSQSNYSSGTTSVNQEKSSTGSYSYQTMAADTGSLLTDSSSYTLDTRPPTVTISDPNDGQTYNQHSLAWAFSAARDDSWERSISCKRYEDGTEVGSYTGSTSYSPSGTTIWDDGQHNVTVSCTESVDDVTTTKSVIFNVDTTPPSVSLIRPDGNESKINTPLNYTASDATSSIDSCWFSVDGESNQTLPTCSNSSFNRTNVGGHNLSLWVNDTQGYVTEKTKDFTAYYTNTFQAESERTSGSISSFEITFTNGTASYNIGGSTSDGTFEVNTSKLPYGDVDVTYKATNYDTEMFDLGTVNASSEFDNRTYQLETAGFSMQVYDESTENEITWPITYSLQNDSVTYQNAWGNEYISHDGDGTDQVEKMPAAFDMDLSTYAELEEGSSPHRNPTLTGYVALKNGINTIHINMNSDSDSEIQNIEMKKSGTWATVADDGLGGTPTSFNFTVDNSAGDYSGKIRLNMHGSDNWGIDIYEVYANNFSLSFDYTEYASEGIPTGKVTAIFDDIDALDTYKSRQYSLTLDQYSKIDLDAYLLKSTQAVTQSIVVVDEQGTGVSDALITIQKNINGSWKTISQKESTGSGTNFFLNPATLYKLIVSKTGYIQATDTFYATGVTPKTVQLASVSEFDFTTLWDSISYKLEPQSSVIPPAYQTFNFTIYDDQAALGEIGLEIYDNATLLDKTNVTGSPSGTTITAAYNFTNYSYGQEIDATWYFERNGSIYNQTRIYTISEAMQPGNRSIIGILNDMGSTTSNAAKGIVALFITLAIATALGSRLKGLGGGIIVLLSIGFFTLIGWMGLPIFMVTLLGIVGVYLARG